MIKQENLKREKLKEKILLLLLAGLVLGLNRSKTKSLKIIKGTIKEWKKIDERYLRKEIQSLYRSKMVDYKEDKDRNITIVLTDKGKLKALTYKFNEMKIERKDWDKKWRVVVFDIPEKLRSGRDALRDKLKELRFYQLQKSIFVFPYKCEDELNFIIEYFDLRPYVRLITAESIDNELHLKKIFNLL